MSGSVLKKRRSTRAFSDRAVGAELLDDLFEAARWAPSNGNRQPWRFLVFSGERRSLLAPALSQGNRWALNAPVLVVVATRPGDGGESNGIRYAVYDCALSVMCLTVEAEFRGLRCHQMAGWSGEELSRICGLPEDALPVVVVAIGYQGDPATLPPGLREKEERPRERRSLDEIRSAGSWRESWNARPEPKR